MAKRMNLPETDLTESVATAEEVYKTNKEFLTSYIKHV